MKRFLITFIICIGSISLIGCSGVNKSISENSNEVINQEDNNEEKEKEDTKRKEELKKAKEEKDAAEKARLEKEKKKVEEAKKKEEVKRIEEEKRRKEEKSKYEEIKKNQNKVFKLYSLDELGDKKIIIGEVKSSSNSIKEDLNKIAIELSNKKFNSMKIEVKEVKNNIAYINLKDSGNNEWVKKWFQGSYGGLSTYTALTESFLQKSYKGDWIRGVVFTYNNKPIEEYDHVNLTGTIYR